MLIETSTKIFKRKKSMTRFDVHCVSWLIYLFGVDCNGSSKPNLNHTQLKKVGSRRMYQAKWAPFGGVIDTWSHCSTVNHPVNRQVSRESATMKLPFCPTTIKHPNILVHCCVVPLEWSEIHIEPGKQGHTWMILLLDTALIGFLHFV